MRRAPTEAERALWRLLRAHRLQGYGFRRQQPIGRYIADFVCFEARMIVEADGSQHVENVHDEQRDAWLRTQGFLLMRFWNNDILARPDAVTDAILHTLHGESMALATPLPCPSPARGEGKEGTTLA